MPRRVRRPARALQARRPAAARARGARAAFPGARDRDHRTRQPARRARAARGRSSASARARASPASRATRLRDELLAGSRVCVCPSVKEGWGITVVEANALGVPVVATDAPGLRDAVIPDEDRRARRRRRAGRAGRAARARRSAACSPTRRG